MTPIEREKVIQARIDGFNYGYDEAVANITKKVRAMHDKEFNALAALFRADESEDLKLKLISKTYEVYQL